MVLRFSLTSKIELLIFALLFGARGFVIRWNLGYTSKSWLKNLDVALRRTYSTSENKIPYNAMWSYSGRDYTNWTYKRVGLTTERRIPETLLYSFWSKKTIMCPNSSRGSRMPSCCPELYSPLVITEFRPEGTTRREKTANVQTRLQPYTWSEPAVLNFIESRAI